MPVTRDQADALAALAVAIRAESRYDRWDRSGIVANIGHVKDRPLADVALAVIRAADSEDLDTPGAIANPRSLCWEERKTDRQRIEPYDRRTFCGWCSQPEHRCRTNPNADHAFESAEQRDARIAREQADRQPLPRPRQGEPDDAE